MHARTDVHAYTLPHSCTHGRTHTQETPDCDSHFYAMIGRQVLNRLRSFHLNAHASSPLLSSLISKSTIRTCEKAATC